MTDHTFDPFTHLHNPAQNLYAPGDDKAKASAADKLAQAYAEDTPDNEARRNASKATAWLHRPDMEKLAEVRDTQPAIYATMSPNLKMELAYYLDGKAAATSDGLST